MTEAAGPGFGLGNLIKDAYRGMVTFQYPDEVARYGFDAVWDALARSGPVCATEENPEGCGHDGCHFDCGCLCS